MSIFESWWWSDFVNLRKDMMQLPCDTLDDCSSVERTIKLIVLDYWIYDLGGLLAYSHASMKMTIVLWWYIV